MTDIVERLRNSSFQEWEPLRPDGVKWPVDSKIGEEAADEITRLRSALSEADERSKLHSADAKTAWAECDALRDELAQARKALEEVTAITARCEHDGGFDREIGPIGCYLGDKCVCIGIHPIAASALLTDTGRTEGERG